MSNVDDRIRRMFTERADQLQGLKGAGGGGTSGGMEARIAKLESDVDHLKRASDKIDGKLDTLLSGQTTIAASIAALSERTATLPKLTTDVSKLEERTTHLPTKPYIFLCMGAVIAAVGALVALLIRFIPPAS